MRPSLRPPWQLPVHLLRWHPRAPQSNPRRIATTSASNTAPIDIPELILSPGSPHHNSLPTFLEYAKRAKLAPTKTVYIGTHYEYTVALALMRLGFSLLRIGKSFDAGIDLIGHWALAPLREPMRVIIQCKARQGSVFPSTMRELEGSFHGIPPKWRNKDVLGLLVTNNKATKGTLETLGQSRYPMGFMMVTREGTVQQFLWNRAASDRGLEGVGVTVRHTPRALLPDAELEEEAGADIKKSQAKFRNAGTKKDIQLTWLGTLISTDCNDLDQETLALLKLVKPDTSTTSSRVRATKRGPGRKPSIHKAPTKRGGMVTGKIGRPKTAVRMLSTLPVVEDQEMEEEVVAEVEKRRPGRPKGSKNKPKRGRPKGSKNKPKRDVNGG
ncbi:hypothetical protein BKA63DRAFT_516815 [Paraphoma chrysanthemicola]|nr:hypothetical protein BKA63DRAFT_516815 [Paraphoma chrysanthemicola]